MKDSYDLFAATDAHITRPRFQAQREQRFYPSEASVKLYDRHGDQIVEGGCLRASYFRLTGNFEPAPYEPYTEFIFRQGKLVEEMLISLWKEMGIWVDNNVKFVDHENNISGELDVILMEPNGQIYIGEVKSCYGYMAEKEIFGNKGQPGFPKMGQLLQTLIYVNHFKNRIPYARMIYFDRGSVKRRTFKISLEEEGSLIYPVVDGEVIRSFTINDIYNRFRELRHYLDTAQVPPNDYELQYPPEKVRDYYQKGKVAKTKYEKWEKGKLGRYEYIGDWMCSYCGFKNICWPDS